MWVLYCLSSLAFALGGNMAAMCGDGICPHSFMGSIVLAGGKIMDVCGLSPFPDCLSAGSP